MTITRQIFNLKSPRNQLLVSSLYFCSATLAIANLAVNGSLFSPVELGLTIAGVGIWAVASTHSLYRKFQSWQHENDDADDSESAIEENMANTPELQRGSTHAAINASLLMGSAVFFIASDALLLNNPTSVVAVRFTGSLLWLKSASMSVWLAKVECRERENHPDAVINPCGIPLSITHFIAECDYLIAGICFTYAIWANPQIFPLKAANNICWLLASLHETIRTTQDMITDLLSNHNGRRIQITRNI